MATFVPFDCFAQDLGRGVHNLHADTLVVYLTNATPSVSADAVKADLAEIATGGGYSGPIDIENTYSQTGGVGTLAGVDKTITATAGGIATWRYAVLANDTATGDPLIGYWDYGEDHDPDTITLNDGETVDLDFATAILTVQF
jgi:hypothetical protein